MRTVDFIVDIMLLSIVLFLIAVPAFYYESLPTEIPIHFNASGLANNYGPKSVIWILAIVGVVLITGLRLVRDQKESFNYPVKITDQNRDAQYVLARGLLQFIAVLSGLMFCHIIYSIVQVTLKGAERASGWVLPLFVIVLFGGLIVYILAVYKVNREVYK